MVSSVLILLKFKQHQVTASLLSVHQIILIVTGCGISYRNTLDT